MHSPQLQLTVPDEFKPALLFAKQQLEAKTKHKAMLVASQSFARLLLGDMNINVEIDAPNDEAGQTTDPSPYGWTGEHQGTPGARN